MPPRARNSRQHAAGQRDREREEHEPGEPPALERGLEQEQDADRRGEAGAEHPAVEGLGALVVADHLGVVLEREARGLEAAVDLRPRPRRVAPAHVERRCRSGATPRRAGSRSAWARCGRRRRRRARTWPPFGVSITRFSMPVRLDVGSSGVLHTVTWNTFCCSKRLPTSSPASIVAAARRTSPGLRPYRLALSRFDLDLDVGLVELPVHPGGRHAVDARHHASGRCAAVASRVANAGPNTRTVMSFGRARVEVANAVVEVRAHALGDAGIGGDGVLDLRHGRAVVGRRIERHPELGGVDVDDLVAEHGPADVRADVGDAGDPRAGRS